MIRIVDFKPEHTACIDLQEKQREFIGTPDENYGEALVRGGVAVTGIDEQGRVIFCAGKNRVAGNKWILWGMLSKQARHHMLQITRVGRRLIALQRGYGELYAIVRSDFNEAHRWIKMLGFKPHKSCPGALPGGLNCDIYVKDY